MIEAIQHETRVAEDIARCLWIGRDYQGWFAVTQYMHHCTEKADKSAPRAQDLDTVVLCPDSLQKLSHTGMPFKTTHNRII
jgi:hypothetical protein